MATIDIDASELNDAIENVEKLLATSENTAANLTSTAAKDLRDEIENQVAVNFEEIGQSEGGSLINAFNIRKSGRAATITTRGSTVDYALALERGISPHFIPKPAGSGPVSFKPENPAAYPDSAQVGGGFVVLDRVFWKPDRSRPTAVGYDYVYEAQNIWANTELPDLIDRRIRRAIRRAGYSRL
jgi:hypothetical protein